MRWSHLLVWACAAALARVGAAAPPAGWEALPEATLEAQRGGFTTAGGLELSLGIERLVSINGTVVAHTELRIEDVRALSGEQAGLARSALGGLQLVQNGANNRYFGSLDQTAGTLVQNSLDNQTIRSQTLISTSVNSLSLLKDMNFNDTLRTAALAGIGAR